MSEDKETQPGFRHRSLSSKPPPRHADLPEPINVSQQPVKSIHQYIAELRHEVRSTRTEFITRQEAGRDAIYALGRKVDMLKAVVDRLQFTIEGLRTAQDHAFKMLKDQQRKERYVVIVLVFCIFAWVVARSYRLVGV